MKICILAMFGLLALANSAKISKRHDNTKEKREANPQPTKEADSYGEPRRAYAYADPGYEQPAYRYENTKAKREANPDSWDLQEEDVYGGARPPHAYADPGYEQPAYRFQNTKDKREANQSEEEHVYELPSGQGSSKHPKKPYADPGYEQPAYRFQKTKYGAGHVKQPAKRSAPDAPDYGAPPAAYEEASAESQYEYDDGAYMRFTRDVKAAYAQPNDYYDVRPQEIYSALVGPYLVPKAQDHQQAQYKYDTVGTDWPS